MRLKDIFIKVHDFICKDYDSDTHYYYANGDEIITIGHQLLLDSVTTNKPIMETSVATVPKIYYINSKERKMNVPWISKRGVGHISQINDKRVTVAVSANEQVLIYGIAICSPEDNFVREKGKELAKQRMLNGFCNIPMSKIKLKGKDLQTTVLQFARNLLAAVEENPTKFERRIAEFNAMRKELVKEVANFTGGIV
jgi:hypothetical protein